MAYRSGSLFMQTTKMYGILSYNSRMYFAREPEDQYPNRLYNTYLDGYIPVVNTAYTDVTNNYFPRYLAQFVPPADCTLVRIGWAVFYYDPDPGARYVHIALCKAGFANEAASADDSSFKTVAIIQPTAQNNDDYDEDQTFCYGVEDFETFTDSTCDTTNDSAVIACDASSRIRSGMVVNGTGIPTNSTVTKISTSSTMPDDFSGSQYDLSANGAVTYFTISANATADGTNVTLTFSWGPDGTSAYCDIDANQAVGWVAQSKGANVGTQNNHYVTHATMTAVFRAK